METNSFHWFDDSTKFFTSEFFKWTIRLCRKEDGDENIQRALCHLNVVCQHTPDPDQNTITLPPHCPAKTKQKQEFSSPTLKRLTLKIFKRKILCLAEIEILGAFVANSPDNNFRSGQRWRRRRQAKEIENLQRSELALSLPPVL